MRTVDSYEIVVKGRLSDALVRGIGTEVVSCDGGLSYLLARDFDQLRLHTLFELLRDLNIEMLSVNAVSEERVALN